MTYIIRHEGEEINRIEGEEGFVSSWCRENGYTWEAVGETVQAETPDDQEIALELLADHEYRLCMLELEGGNG